MTVRLPEAWGSRSLVFSVIAMILLSPGARGKGNQLGDTAVSVIVRTISIAGNTITRPGVILRELTFRQNDTLSLKQFNEMLTISRQNIFNTRLFNFVSVDTTFSGPAGYADVCISVVERWYIWPVPFLEVSDRNFNVWLESRDFRRLSYGVDLKFFNVRGRNETLKLMAHFGFNQKFGFTYKIPYVDRRQKLGAGFGFTVDLNRELAAETWHNEPVYMRSDNGYLRKLVTGYADLSFRPDFFSTYIMRVSYARYDFDSAVLSVPGFSIQSSDVQQYVSLTCIVKNDHRDVAYYPLQGYYVEAELNHTVPYATALNSYLLANVKVYSRLLENVYWAAGFTGKLSFEKQQPYFLQRGLGYGKDYVRGYEFYVVDGQHFALLKTNIKYALIPQHTAKLGFLKSEKFNRIPLALYLNAFVDLGFAYAYDQGSAGQGGGSNNLQNSFLTGYGMGLDFATYYDVVVRAEVSVNRMQQPGFYLHFVAPI